MPLNAFVVRPFGTKEVVETPMRSSREPKELKVIKVPGEIARLKPDQDVVARRVQTEGSQCAVSINFDLVHQVLIQPAMDRLGINGETADAIVAAGNIREDMLNRLLTADLVIADLSLHNANVLYELGIRQAFRDKHTFVLRCNVSDYPFDLRTDRYFEYDWAEPWRSVDKLVQALRATISSEKADSPVFKLLPTLEAEDRSRFISVAAGLHGRGGAGTEVSATGRLTSALDRGGGDYVGDRGPPSGGTRPVRAEFRSRGQGHLGADRRPASGRL
jgi:hypothetical protein